MAKQKHSEVTMTAVAEAPKAATNYNELFHKIDHLQGKEKQKFTKTLTQEEKKRYLDYLKEKDSPMVTGVFRCYEPLGGSLTMTCMAFDGETPAQYTFVDGQTYTVPRYVAKRFESDFQGIGTWYPTHAYVMDAQGKPIPMVGKKTRRFGFSSMD